MIDFLLQNQATTLADKLKNVAFCFVCILIWVLSVRIFLTGLYVLDSSATFVNFSQTFFTCIFAPIWEELVFRVAPISIAKNIGKEYIIPVIIISSVIFGWGHGEGSISLLYQGMMGVMFSFLYVKNNFCYGSSVMAHCAWNTFCTFT